MPTYRRIQKTNHMGQEATQIIMLLILFMVN